MSRHATPENPDENADSLKGPAPRAAVDHGNAPLDPNLQMLIDAWPVLPDTVKAGILAIVRAVPEAGAALDRSNRLLDDA